MSVRIKRYKNRKLYSLSSRSYVTMPRILEILRQGTDVRVHEYDGGADITGYVLAEALSRELRTNPSEETLTALKKLISTSELLEQRALTWMSDS